MMSQEEMAIREQLKREAKEIEELRQQCLNAQHRLSQKERELKDAAAIRRSNNDYTPMSTDRTDVLLNKRDKLRNMEGEAERKLSKRRRRRQGKNQDGVQENVND